MSFLIQLLNTKDEKTLLTAYFTSFKKNRQPLIATLIIHLHLPTCASLKEKRGRIKPLISRLHREFNISVAEIDLNDKWQEAVIGCAMIGNDQAFLQSALGNVAKWVAGNWSDGDIIEQRIEII